MCHVSPWYNRHGWLGAKTNIQKNFRGVIIIVMTLIQTPRHDNRLERRVFEAVRRGNINTVSALMTEHGPQRILSMEMVSRALLQPVGQFVRTAYFWPGWFITKAECQFSTELIVMGPSADRAGGKWATLTATQKAYERKC